MLLALRKRRKKNASTALAQKMSTSGRAARSRTWVMAAEVGLETTAMVQPGLARSKAALYASQSSLGERGDDGYLLGLGIGGGRNEDQDAPNERQQGHEREAARGMLRTTVTSLGVVWPT